MAKAQNKTTAKNDTDAQSQPTGGTATVQVEGPVVGGEQPIAVAGPALNPAQRAGLEPVDAGFDAEQAEKRDELPNQQTDYERDAAIDPVSRTPSPGIVSGASLTGVDSGQYPTDMSGRPPTGMGGLSDDDKEVASTLRQKLTDAKREDGEGHRRIPEEQRGWRSPAEMGIAGAAVKRIMEAGAPIEARDQPAGHFFPETGTRYRLK